MSMTSKPSHAPAGGTAQISVERPVVSIVFLAHNRREALRESLRRMLREGSYPPEQIEVVVVDNASTDGTAAMLEDEHRRVVLVDNERNEGAPGWNAGFAIASGEYVLILDDDAYLPRGALRQVVEAARAEDADLVSFSVVSSFNEDHRLNDDWRTGLLSYWGCAALVSRRALDLLHGYDPNIFIWGNETEFTMRLLDAGLTHLFLPEVHAVHMKRPILSFERRRYLVNARHHAYMAGKLMRTSDALAAVAAIIVASALDFLVEERIAACAAPFAIVGFAEGLRRRHPVRGAVSRAYRDNFRPFSGPVRFLRTPGERWRSRANPECAEAQRVRRQRRYFDERPRFHPQSRASLSL
jgi:GT2 family glycosyltransferase